MVDKRNFKDLVVWQRAMDLVESVYALVKTFPAEERYALADQLRRAVVSVPTNIAEGQGRQHSKEFRQFCWIAKGSLSEVYTLVSIAHRLAYIGDEQFESTLVEIESVARPLSGLIGSL